jgi:hypothetical protein
VNLWVDDAKSEPDETWARAKTYEDAMRMLAAFNYETVALDHDLGDAGSPTGYDILCAMERGELRRPKCIRLISWNPVGRARMAVVVRRLGLETR